MYIGSVNKREGKIKMKIMYIIAYILKISERIFNMLKVVTCKEENWVAEGRGREETLYPVTI